MLSSECSRFRDGLQGKQHTSVIATTVNSTTLTAAFLNSMHGNVLELLV